MLLPAAAGAKGAGRDARRVGTLRPRRVATGAFAL